MILSIFDVLPVDIESFNALTLTDIAMYYHLPTTHWYSIFIYESQQFSKIFNFSSENRLFGRSLMEVNTFILTTSRLKDRGSKAFGCIF